MTNLGIEKSVKSLSLAVTEFVCKLFAAAKKIGLIQKQRKMFPLGTYYRSLTSHVTGHISL